MNSQKARGTRSRVDASQLKTPFNTGTPSHDDEPDTDDETGQNSDGGTQADDKNQDTKDNASTESELSDDGESSSNQYGHSPEEKKEFEDIMKNLASERKRRQDGQRKITEQGNENSELKKRLEKAESDNAILRKQIADSLMGENSTSQYDFGDEQGDGSNNGLTPDDAQMLRSLYNKVHGSVQNLESRFQENEEQALYERDIAYLQQEIGMDKEAAEAFYEAYEQGDVVACAQLIELTSLPKEARQTAKKYRQERRTAASVGHPGTPQGSYIPEDTVDDATREKRAKEIFNKKAGTTRRKAIEDALAEDPGLAPFIKAESGFTL